jgi:hypothetical protein
MLPPERTQHRHSTGITRRLGGSNKRTDSIDRLRGLADRHAAREDAPHELETGQPPRGAEVGNEDLAGNQEDTV